MVFFLLCREGVVAVKGSVEDMKVKLEASQSRVVRGGATGILCA